MNEKKIGMSSLIKEFFGMTAAQAVKEYRELSDIDKVQLASAAARALEIPEEECSFDFVAY